MKTACFCHLRRYKSNIVVHVQPRNVPDETNGFKKHSFFWHRIVLEPFCNLSKRCWLKAPSISINEGTKQTCDRDHEQRKGDVALHSLNRQTRKSLNCAIHYIT